MVNGSAYSQDRGSICFLGIGSNMGDPIFNCRDAISRVSKIRGANVLRTSSFYRTEPLGVADQPWFVNAVIEMRCYLSPAELLPALKGIEKDMGRKEVVRWGPRVIDIDILLFGQDIVNEDNLVIPHPEFHKRRFALLPLNELAPYAIHPAFGVSVKGLLERLEDSSAVELIGRQI